MTGKHDLGKCCGCEVDGPQVRNICMLPFKADTPDYGWGCFECGLPCEGAVAVLCDTCLNGDASEAVDVIKFAVVGEPSNNHREPMETTKLREPHKHDTTKHEGYGALN